MYRAKHLDPIHRLRDHSCCPKRRRPNLYCCICNPRCCAGSSPTGSGTKANTYSYSNTYNFTATNSKPYPEFAPNTCAYPVSGSNHRTYSGSNQ